MNVAATTTPTLHVHRQPPVIGAVRDTLAVTWRNLVTYMRIPQLLVFSTIQPVIFVLMFRYVFGGAIKVPGGSYVDYLMPGIFTQTVVFGAIGTAIGLATDVQSGLLERFRALPMSRVAVLAGRTDRHERRAIDRVVHRHPGGLRATGGLALQAGGLDRATIVGRRRHDWEFTPRHSGRRSLRRRLLRLRQHPAGPRPGLSPSGPRSSLG